MMKNLIDARDERIAREMREGYGRCGWLVSWYPRDDDTWLARLSCPDVFDTVEEIGRTRREAIALAEAELTRRLARLHPKEDDEDFDHD